MNRYKYLTPHQRHWVDKCRMHNFDLNVKGGSTTSAPKRKEIAVAIKVTTPTMINGRSADSYDVDALIGLIVDSELAIEGFNKVNTESKTVKALVAREQAGIADLVKILDNRKID